MINNKSNIRVKQSKRKDSKSEKHWFWSIWIDAEKDVLDEINNVEYILHPTFRNRVRNISSSKNKFKLTSKGWGEFTIFIRVYFKKNDLKPLYLSHDLTLFSIEKDKQQRVFISSQIKDKESKETLSDSLENENYIVSTIDNIGSNSNFSESIVESIDDSDIMVVIGSDITKSQEYEIFHAMDLDKSIYIMSDEINKKFKGIIHVSSKDALISDLEKKRNK